MSKLKYSWYIFLFFCFVLFEILKDNILFFIFQLGHFVKRYFSKCTGYLSGTIVLSSTRLKGKGCLGLALTKVGVDFIGM